MQEQFLDPIRFELEFPSVFKQFMEWGFIIEEGVNELDILKFRHNEHVFKNRNYHLVLSLTEAYDPKIELIQALKHHIVLMVEKECITSLLIDWNITPDYKRSFHKIINAINNYARHLCEQRSIPFNSQADLTSRQLSIYDAQSLNDDGVTCYSLSLSKDCISTKDVVVDIEKKKHAFIDNINALSKYANRSKIQVVVSFDNNSEPDKLVTILNNISKDVLKNISIKFQQDGFVSSYEELSEYMHALDDVVKNFGIDVNTDFWNQDFRIRNFYNVVDTSGKVYLWKAFCLGDEFGKLSADGTIEWDRIKRDSVMGHVWFENEKCSKCLYLPTMETLCIRKLSYYGNATFVQCPLSDKNINPDTFIIRMFEYKTLLTHQ